MATASRLEAAVELALGRAPSELVLDLRAVSFIDSTGLRAIMRARNACEHRAVEFFLVPSERAAEHRLFRVSGLIGMLTFREPDAATLEPDAATLQPDAGTLEPDAGTLRDPAHAQPAG